MLGSLRFALAMAVAFSHMGLTPDFHFGSMAVVVFYLIAGYVMTHSFSVNFDGRLSRAPAFYLDRFFRIYPLYALSLLLIWAFCRLSGYGVLYTDWRSMVANLGLLQLNSHPTIMNPASWSLGTEVQFYLLLPLLAYWRPLKYALLPLSYAVFLAATFGVIDTQTWSYKLLPGTLFVFILGSVLYDLARDPADRRSRMIVLSMVAVGAVHLAVMSCFPAHAEARYSLESLSGLLTGIALLYLLGTVKPSHRGLDDWLGKLSYPIFLSHVVVLYAFDYLRLHGAFAPNLRGAVALQLLATMAFSVPLVWFDDYFQRWRKRLQQRRAQAPAAAPAAATAAA
ncbi:peptidoglycan/LPS O-acetylase OafA/YrhL [Lysobacter enzymogenes]|uniref:acyltransferase family protein n=1 Tax=Lysobacter enzymogenes TaxID=69 RepID=UPI00339A5BEE